MIITKTIFRAFLSCPHKAYLLSQKEVGIKSEYETVFSNLDERYHKEGIKHLQVNNISSGILGNKHLKGNIGCFYRTNIENNGVKFSSVVQRVKGSSALGSFHYVPVIFSRINKLSKEDKLIFAYEGFILQKMQERQIGFGYAVRGDVFKISKVHIANQIENARKVIAVIKKMSTNPPRMILNRHCSICEFTNICRTKAIEKDDLSLLAGIPPKEIEIQNKRGIFTVTQFSYTFRPRKKFRKAYPFNLKALALREKKTHLYGTPAIPTSSVQIYFDVEGDPDRDFHYLIGMVIVENGIEKRHSFWANRETEERSTFLAFIDSIRSYNDFTLYHYGSYETKFLKKVQSYVHDPDDVRIIEKMFENAVNVLLIVYNHVFFPTYSNGLKDVGAYLGFKWTSNNASGINSLVWRAQFEESRDDIFKKKLLKYNLEDCLALKMVAEFVSHVTKGVTDKELSHIDCIQADDLKTKSSYKWGVVDFALKDMKHINDCAYFDYQREKVFIRTDKQLSKAKSKPRKTPKRIYPINKHINVKFKIKCPQCGKRMYRWIRSSKRVIDLKFTKVGIKRWVEFYQIYKRRCPRCNSSLTDTTLRDLPKYGHSLKSFVIYNNVVNHQVFDKISDTLKDLFDLSISGPCLNNFKTVFSEYYKETYQQILEKIIQGNMVHIDETPISIKKQTGYVWVFASMEEVYFFYRSTREGQFLNELLKNFKGVLISDFYAAYDSIECPQQKCLVHLIRDLNDDLRSQPFNEEYKEIATYFTLVLRQIVDTIDQYGLKRRNLNKHKKMVNKFFKKVVGTLYTSELAQKYQKRFKKNQDKLFTFLNYDGIPWNNNNAEHALKSFAAYRHKIDFQISEDGLKKQLLFLSIYQTCKYRGINFLKFLVSKKTDIESYANNN